MTALRYAIRRLAKRPGIPILIMALLAVSIGTTTAIFSVFHKVLMEDLPVPEPDRLVNLRAPGPKWGFVSDDEAGDSSYVFSYPMFRDLQTLRGSFSGIAAHHAFAANVSTGQRTQAGYGQLVSGNYFQLLALRPALGRLIAPYDEPGLGESRVAVLSYEFWQSRFGGDPDVLDTTIIVNGEPLTVIGVAPKGFTGITLGVRPQVFVPLTLRWLMQPGAAPAADERRAYWLYLFGRLAPGAQLESASTEINRLYSAILNEIEAPLNGSMPPDILRQFRARRVELEPGAHGQSALRTFLAQPLTLLLTLTGVVLAIVCVNAGSLLLARASSRGGELAVRASLGATRWRLAANMLLEAALLALAGMTLGLPVAWAALEFLVTVLPASLSGDLTAPIDSTHVAFAAVVALSTLALFGVAPAMFASQSDLAGTLRGQSRATDAMRLARFRRALGTAQIAFSLTLLVLAGLFLQSFRNISNVDLGISVDSIVTFTVAPGLSGYTEERARSGYTEIEEHLSSIPGVEAVGSSSVRLLSNDSAWNSLSVEGFAGGPGVNTNAATNWVNSDFFRSLSIPLLQGRGFTPADAKGTANVAVVNESFVRKFGLEERAIGARFGIGDTTNLDIEIVGVVGDSRYGTVKGAPPPQYFRPVDQGDELESMSFYVRTSTAPEAVGDQIRERLEALAPDLPISDLTTMRTVAQDNVFVERAIALLSLSYAVLATAVAGIGLYGMLLYNLAQRTRELGLRLALGATARRLRLMVLKEVGLMVLIGTIVGLVAAGIAGRAANSLLYGIPGFDAFSAAVAVAILALVALFASYFPIRRALRTTPVEALR
ncbi:MAG TPA: ABC transporter permease [Gammaproteobacteria bacterium]